MAQVHRINMKNYNKLVKNIRNIIDNSLIIAKLQTYREECNHALINIQINKDTLAQAQTINMKNYNKLVKDIINI